MEDPGISQRSRIKFPQHIIEYEQWEDPGISQRSWEFSFPNTETFLMCRVSARCREVFHWDRGLLVYFTEWVRVEEKTAC